MNGSGKLSKVVFGWVRDEVPPYLIGMDVFFQICFETSSVMEVPDLKYY